MTVTFGEDVENLVQDLKKEYGDIIFYQSFGCCDNSVALCYAKKDFKLGVNDVCLYEGEIFDFYTHKNQEDFYKNQNLNISVKNESGNEYSLEYEFGKSFVFEFS